ncbi:hypothetical protein L596_004825 [Steinernema carpocapsae]|uniref:Piwi domain-containing protein n=1 Tax=Steinernema carpocapsae TaxID=34508 RepID=A0A4U8UYL6_STECR|nr:hypothetical protein L596_004825 [Steinernema carpocapsae]
MDTRSQAQGGFDTSIKVVYEMAPKQYAPENKAPVDLVCNAYRLRMPQPSSDYPARVYVYDVTLTLTRADGSLLTLVKTKMDDYTHYVSKQRCRSALEAFSQKFPGFFRTNEQRLFYDLQSILFTRVELPMRNLTEAMSIEASEFSRFGFAEGGQGMQRLNIVVQKTQSGTSIGLTDFSFLSSDIAEVGQRHDLSQFIEICSSQNAYMNPDQRVTFPGGVSYERGNPGDLVDGSKRVWNGVRKSVRYLTGAGNPVPAVVLDARKSAFHKEGEMVSDKVYAMGLMNDDGSVFDYNIDNITRQLKGLFVMVKHLNNQRTFPILKLDKKTPATYRFTSDDGVEMSVADYMSKKYGTALEYPKSPLVVVWMKQREVHYPMEMLYVCPNQRVTTNQQTSKLVSEMIKKCAIVPSERIKEIKHQATSLHLHDGALREVCIEVDPNMLHLQGKAVEAPKLKYGSSALVSVERNTGKWRTSNTKFLHPVQIKKWAVIVLPTGGKLTGQDSQVPTKFVDLMIKALIIKGVQVGPPAYTGMSSGCQLEEDFKECARDGYDFMFFIQDSKLQFHKDIKVMERRYEIVTQDLNLNTARNVVQQRKHLSLENIICKTNVKLGGVNYSIHIDRPEFADFFHDRRLYVGMQMSNSRVFELGDGSDVEKAGKPTIIGISANVDRELSSFVGDFMCGPANIEDLSSVVTEIFKYYSEEFLKMRGHFPEEIVVYIGGISDGDMPKLLRWHIPAIRHGLNTAKCTAKMTVIFTSKSHNVRLFPKNVTGERAPEQNVKPGTVVDTGIVHPEFTEFFVTSHQTLQGTAKVPKYTVMIDDNNLSLSYLETMTYVLAFGHQIVALPTSLPTPLYVAGRYGDRGGVLYNAFDGKDDLYAVNDQLTFATSKKLCGKRVNA